MSGTPEVGTVGLDPRWLAAELGARAAGFDRFIGTGQMSRNARFSLDWAGDDGPATVVVKVPSGEASTRAMSFDHGVYHKECEFYRSIAPLVDIAVPRPLAVHFDEAGRDFVIVLEDLTESEQGDQFTEPTAEELELAIGQAAALHAPLWDATDHAAVGFLHEPVEERAVIAGLMVEGFLPIVFDRLGDGLGAEISELLERFAGAVPEWVRRRGAPTTLVHRDFRPDNFMFGTAASAPPLAVVDWQTLGLGSGAEDIAYLLGGSLAPERRRRIEADMLSLYRAELEERGVEYSAERCADEYALGSLHGVMVAVSATAIADETERGDALFTLMLERHGRHALDQAALDRL